MVEPSPPNAEKLAEFFQSTERQVTPELTEILEVVATSGKVWHDWEHLRALVLVQMDAVLETYNKSRLAVDVGPPRPLLGGESLEGLQQRLHALLEAIPGPPFTIQRLCEVLLWPHETYSSIDKLALAIEKLMMVTQTITRTTDPYPPLPLPPHQPAPARKPPPQPMQPRLSFGHQPHPEANPDQLEEHELNLHQNQTHQGNHQGNHHMHRNEAEQKVVMPSFLEADGPAPRHPEGPAATPLENVFGGVEKRENSPPGFVADGVELGHMGSGHVEAPGPSDGAGRKRSFEESSRQGELFTGHAGEIVTDPGEIDTNPANVTNQEQSVTNPVSEDGVFSSVGHQAMELDSVDALMPENGSVIDAPPGVIEPLNIAHKEADAGNLETLLKPVPLELTGGGHVEMPREESTSVDGAYARSGALPVPTGAETAPLDSSIEPMTPPPVVKEGSEARPMPSVNPEHSIENTIGEEKVGEVHVPKESGSAI